MNDHAQKASISLSVKWDSIFRSTELQRGLIKKLDGEEVSFKPTLAREWSNFKTFSWTSWRRGRWFRHILCKATPGDHQVLFQRTSSTEWEHSTLAAGQHEFLIFSRAYSRVLDKCIFILLDQGSTKYNPWAKSTLPPVVVSKILLEHSLVPFLWQQQAKEFLFYGPFKKKKFADSCFRSTIKYLFLSSWEINALYFWNNLFPCDRR